MRSLLLGLALAIAAHVSAAERYEFFLDGKLTAPEIISLSGNPKTPAPGDVVQFREYSFVLDAPGRYDLRQHKEQPYRLFRLGEDGKETLIACHVATHYRRLTDEERKGGASPKGESINPLDGLTPADLAALRGVEIANWTANLSAELRQLDLTHCWLDLKLFEWDKPVTILKSIPPTARYLNIREASIPSTLEPHDLKDLKDLRVLRHERLVPDYDLESLQAMRELRYLDISSSRRATSHPEALTKLTELRTLLLNGEQNLHDLSLLRPLIHLRELEISSTKVEDLSALADLPELIKVNAEMGAATRLPNKAMPALRELQLLGSPVDAKSAAPFQAANPQCDVRYDWEATLQKALAGSDRVRVVGQKDAPPMTHDHLLSEERDPQAIAELISAFVVDDSTSPFHCMCAGSPWLQFYRGEQLLATIPVQHGFGIRWHKGWPADRVLILRGQDKLTNWLAIRGIKGPREELTRKRLADRAEARRMEFVQGILPASVLEQLGKARSEEEAVAAFTKNMPDTAQRAEACLRLFGGDYGSWSHTDGLDNLLKQQLLPQFTPAVLSAVKIAPRMQSANGLGRWLFFERKWSDWKPEELNTVLEVVAGDALTHPRDVNRRKTIIALGQIKTPTARKLLRSVVRGELTLRPLPEGAEAEAGGMVTYTPEPKDLPKECSDTTLAAIWLTRLDDADSKADVQKLLGTLQGEERTSLEQALATKR